MEATIPFVSDVAEATLGGGYLMDYSKEKNFVNGLRSFISPSVSLERLSLLGETCKAAEKANSTCVIDPILFLNSKTPINKIKENLDVFEKVDSSMQLEKINLTDFLEKNVNLY